MNAVVTEWLKKAEGDFLTAQRELMVTEHPNHDAVCFHAQQCIEKIMKGLLTSRGQLPPRTHDLVRLAELLTKAAPEWSWPLPDLRLLDRAAIAFRYPGESAETEEAELAMQTAVRLRQSLLELLKNSEESQNA